MRKILALLALLLCGTFFSSLTSFADSFPVNGVVNFENPHVSPLALTPDGDLLLAVNTAGNSLEVFDVFGGSLQQITTIPVGLDPVSVRARTNSLAWVVNHISDSISVVDLVNFTVIETVSTCNEPADVVFAGSPQRAFVSCSQPNAIQVFNPDTLQLQSTLNIAAEEPRALAVSADGQRVYAAAFESGNATTVLNGRLGPISTGEILGAENVVSRPEGPYLGQNPPPNNGTSFNPPINVSNGTPPPSSMIVRKDNQNQWLDDNNRNWSIFVSGPLASLTRRVIGWDLPDRDVAIINAQTLAVGYQTRLMNMVMALAVNPVTGQVTAVGTDATNEVRFEPNVNGRFLRVNLATFNSSGGNAQVTDLNPHLNYIVNSIPVSQRNQSIGDPRGIAWRGNGNEAFITGMGSNNVIVINQQGQRLGRFAVGEGPTGIVLDESSDRGFVLNKFAGSISIFSLSQRQSLQEVSFFDPTPAVIKAGRPFLYNTHDSSGLGHIACASCHVDARTDRLSWDLGNPAGVVITTLDGKSLHPMKGPMRTQSLQDIIAHQGMHWRGDRFDLDDFNPAFVSLMSADASISVSEMIAFENFLDTIHFPPNPFRNLNNSLPTSLVLPDGRVVNAALGRNSLNTTCMQCHTDGVTRANTTDLELSQAFIPPSFFSFYDALGYLQQSATESTSGTGFFHDGADPLMTVARQPQFLGAILTIDGPGHGLTSAQRRQDTHAAVGQQITINGPRNSVETARLNQLISIANSSPHAALIVKGTINNVPRGLFLISGNIYQADRSGETWTLTQLLNVAEAGQPLTFTVVAKGTEVRFGVDRDLDGIFDGNENIAPVITNPGEQSHDEGTSIFLQIQASDANGDSLTYSASGLPAGLSINSVTGVISGTLAAGSAGNYTVTVSVNDGANVASEIFSWTVIAISTGEASEMLAPVPGTTLSGATVTFEWQDVGATQHWLEVGASQGSAEYGGGDQGTSTSATLSGLPTDGSTVHVRLWTIFGFNWLSNDYQYTSGSGGGGGGGNGNSQIISPQPNSTLSGSSVTFQWSDEGADQYWLEVGSSSGGAEYFGGDQGTSTSATVSGLPTDGSTVYVRLWTIRGFSWQANQFQFTASSGGGGGGGGSGNSEIISPVPNTTLPGSTVTFQWSDVGADQYWLEVGLSQGSGEFGGGDQGTSTSATISGLPTDGSTVHVRLWTISGFSWVFEDFTFSTQP